MGALLTKVLNEISSEDLPEEENRNHPGLQQRKDDDDDAAAGVVDDDELTSNGIMEDPRSPATAGVDRTPLPSAMALDNQAPWDPRSPTSGIVRTPMHPPLFDTPPASAESSMLPQQETGPVGAAGPLAVECEVHRSWHAEHDSVLEEWDSLYPNPDSGACRSDHGSLENLLLSNTLSIASENSLYMSTDGEINNDCEGLPAGPDVSPIGSPAKNTLSAYSEDAAVEKVHSSTPLKPAAAAATLTPNLNISSMSTEKCTSKGLTVRHVNTPSVSVEKSTSRGLSERDPNSPMTSTSKSSTKGLTAKDSNSPLLLLRRKQVAKAGTQLVSKVSGDEAMDKENVVQ